MREWWRWALRGVAVLALVAGGILLTLHPTATYQAPGQTQSRTILQTNWCVSPFERLTGNNLTMSSFLARGAANPEVSVGLATLAACNAATNDREHTSEALGIGAILLSGCRSSHAAGRWRPRDDRSRCRSSK